MTIKEEALNYSRTHGGQSCYDASIGGYEACAKGESVQALVGALRFYADGKCDLEPKPEKAHLYVKDFEMNSPEWLQRSMSDFVSGRKARDAIEAWERATK